MNARLVCVSPYSMHKNPSFTRLALPGTMPKGILGELPSAGRGGW